MFKVGDIVLNKLDLNRRYKVIEVIDDSTIRIQRDAIPAMIYVVESNYYCSCKKYDRKKKLDKIKNEYDR